MSEAVPCTDLSFLLRMDVAEVQRGYPSSVFHLPGDVLLSLWSTLTGSSDVSIGGTCPSPASKLAVGTVALAGLLALAVAGLRMLQKARSRRSARSGQTFGPALRSRPAGGSDVDGARPFGPAVMSRDGRAPAGDVDAEAVGSRRRAGPREFRRTAERRPSF